jgi:signal recognition particle GTPase
MFESLGQKLGKVFTGLRGKGSLREGRRRQRRDARNPHVALLEADVALPVVKTFIENVKGAKLSGRKSSLPSRPRSRSSKSFTTPLLRCWAVKHLI